MGLEPRKPKEIKPISETLSTGNAIGATAGSVLWFAATIQALDRARAVRWPRRILVLNSLDLRRRDDNPAKEGLGVHADRCMSWPEIRNGGNRAETVLEASGGFLPIAPTALAHIAPEIFSGLEAAKKWLQRTELSEALVHYAEYLTCLKVRPTGQRGASWPLIVDRRRQACLSAARAAFEAMVGVEKAVWQVGDGSRP